METEHSIVYGELTVVEELRGNGLPHPKVRVKCSCGNEKWIRKSLVVSGQFRDCRRGVHHPSLIDLTGRVFGNLTVRAYDAEGSLWKCECSCGNFVYKKGGTLIANRTNSCGCKYSETLSKVRVKDSHKRIAKSIMKGYMYNARNRNLEFDITLDEFSQLLDNPCHYCGRIRATYFNDGDMVFPITDFYYNGVDRVDNARGYIKGNYVACCKTCNISKRDMTVSDWTAWIKRVYEYQFGS